MEVAMILVRDVFKAKYGKGSELVALFKEAMKSWASNLNYRILTDLSGPFFTVVTEEEVESYEAWEKRLEEVFGHPEFAGWFAKMEPLVESGSREFYTIE
jgi:hypothetical protein